MTKLFPIVILLALCGCSAKYANFTAGENDVVGISIPGQQSVQVSAISHLNGIAWSVKDPAKAAFTFSQASTNSYFGVITTTDVKSGELTLEPMNCQPIAEETK